ncbi:MAG TPA: hypothetical protein VE755_04980 [Myxococcales bacterium]|jgi:hypothetical protein|nr:hypothetical protein [Myxococcales bacterium]
MNRIVCSLLAAGAAALAIASPARAEPRYEQPYTPYGYEQPYTPYPYEQWGPGHRYAWRAEREREWRELYRARRHFYAYWNGNPWARARFERWYSRRCAELRFWRG